MNGAAVVVIPIVRFCDGKGIHERGLTVDLILLHAGHQDPRWPLRQLRRKKEYRGLGVPKEEKYEVRKLIKLKLWSG